MTWSAKALAERFAAQPQPPTCSGVNRIVAVYATVTAPTPSTPPSRASPTNLHHQYALGFTPTKLDGKMHTLDVRIAQPGRTARARKSYLATTPRS